MDVEFATETMWRALGTGDHDPVALRGQLSIGDTPAILLGLLDRYVQAGERHAGWKVGLTAKAIQAQIGHHEPVFGFLLECDHLLSGSTLDLKTLIHPKIENELCLTIGTTLRGPGVTFEQARAAIAQVAPAFEIAEQRHAPPMDMAMVLADRCQNKGFVTGGVVPLCDLDLATVTVDIVVNGLHQERASGGEVLGVGPIASVVWLANKLAGYGRALEAGSRVMSGSFTRQYDPSPGDRIEARFASVGTVAIDVR